MLLFSSDKGFKLGVLDIEVMAFFSISALFLAISDHQ